MTLPPRERDTGNCSDMCPRCSRTGAKIFLPIRKSKLIKLFESTHWHGSVPLVVDKDNIVNVLWGKTPKWRVEEIYGKKTVVKFNVDALFLQLIASNILVLHKVDDKLIWMLGRKPDPNKPRDSILNYQMNDTWKYITLLDE